MEADKTKAQFEQRLIEKAMKDDGFRHQLLDNPRETIGLELGIKIPESIQIHVVQEDPTSVYLVLPPKHDQQGDELSEAELAGVAGGTDVWSEGDQCWMDYL
jgi:hypothetical protein